MDALGTFSASLEMYVEMLFDRYKDKNKRVFPGLLAATDRWQFRLPTGRSIFSSLGISWLILNEELKR